MKTIDELPGARIALDGVRNLVVDEVLYFYDSPLLFVGTINPPREGDPNLFINIADSRDDVVHMATTVTPEELDALRSDTMPIRDAFERDGTFATRCGHGWKLEEMTRIEKVADIPGDWLSEPDVTLHPVVMAP